MRMVWGKKLLVMFAGVTVAGLATGCHIETHKTDKDERVNIATPFGGLQVKTDDAAVQNGVGLEVYPGAERVKEEKGNTAADVHLDLGNFHMGVKALTYRTSDSPEKVAAFYRSDMARYGAVIVCHDHRAVGTPTRTQEGLSCDGSNGSGVHVNEVASPDELKAGSKQHQHIVGLQAEPYGTKIGLVALDLPGQFTKDDSDNRQ